MASSYPHNKQSKILRLMSKEEVGIKCIRLRRNLCRLNPTIHKMKKNCCKTKPKTTKK